MLDGYFIHDCTVYPHRVDEYNDQRNDEYFTTSCHFRDNTALNNQTQSLNREEETSDAMAWFRPGENVEKGYVITVDGQAYRIIRIVHARRLGEQSVQFIKCWLERFEAFVS